MPIDSTPIDSTGWSEPVAGGASVQTAGALPGGGVFLGGGEVLATELQETRNQTGEAGAEPRTWGGWEHVLALGDGFVRVGTTQPQGAFAVAECVDAAGVRKWRWTAGPTPITATGPPLRTSEGAAFLAVSGDDPDSASLTLVRASASGARETPIDGPALLDRATLASYLLRVDPDVRVLQLRREADGSYRWRVLRMAG